MSIGVMWCCVMVVFLLKIFVKIHCKSHSYCGLDDLVSFLAMVASDYCIVVDFCIKYKKVLL